MRFYTRNIKCQKGAIMAKNNEVKEMVEILEDKISREVLIIEMLYEANDLVSYYCEALSLYSVNYSDVLDRKRLIGELYNHLYEEETGKVYNTSPFKGESGWKIATFCRDRKNFSRRDCFYYGGEKFMFKMHKFLNKEIRKRGKK